MKTLVKKIAIAFAVISASLSFTTTASAQIIILDGARVSQEAEANKDVISKTAKLREEINTLSQYLKRDGGGYLIEAKQIEDKKALVGQKKYEEEMKALENKYRAYNRLLVLRRNQFDTVLAEANRQVERASMPITKSLLTKYKAQVMMYKVDVIRHVAGIDVTTEFIEMLNDSLPSVDITVNMDLPQQQGAKPATPKAPAKADPKK